MSHLWWHRSKPNWCWTVSPSYHAGQFQWYAPSGLAPLQLSYREISCYFIALVPISRNYQLEKAGDQGQTSRKFSFFHAYINKHHVFLSNEHSCYFKDFCVNALCCPGRQAWASYIYKGCPHWVYYCLFRTIPSQKKCMGREAWSSFSKHAAVMDLIGHHTYRN